MGFPIKGLKKEQVGFSCELPKKIALTLTPGQKSKAMEDIKFSIDNVKIEAGEMHADQVNCTETKDLPL